MQITQEQADKVIAALERLACMGIITIHNGKPVWTFPRQLEKDVAESISIMRGLDDGEPVNDEALWLWKNGDHMLAYRHLYPCYEGGDPMVLGEPIGKAYFRQSFDRGHTSPQAAPAQYTITDAVLYPPGNPEGIRSPEITALAHSEMARIDAMQSGVKGDGITITFEPRQDALAVEFPPQELTEAYLCKIARLGQLMQPEEFEAPDQTEARNVTPQEDAVLRRAAIRGATIVDGGGLVKTEAQEREAFEAFWHETRGKKKAARELQRHELQPQTYRVDSANRHWTTWKAGRAGRKG